VKPGDRREGPGTAKAAQRFDLPGALAVISRLRGTTGGPLRGAKAETRRLNADFAGAWLRLSAALDIVQNAFARKIESSTLALADAVASTPAAWRPCLLTYAAAGDQSRVKRLLPRFTSAPPLGFYSFDVAPFSALVNGMLQVKRGKANEALQALGRAARYEQASRYLLMPQYWRGYAFLGAKRPADAVAEFQKVMALRPLGGFSPTWPLAHVGLARAYAAGGDTAASRKAYEDFFALWKNADPDVPILVEARKEYAALK
jgi:tetratricopeptide (TPR) repeat protein